LEGTSAVTSLPLPLATLITNWQMAGGGMPVMVELSWPGDAVQMVSLAAIREAEGHSMGWVAVLRDITHLKQLETVKNQMLVESARKIRLPLAQAMNYLVELNIYTSSNPQMNELVEQLTQTWMRIQEWGDDINILTRIDAQASYQPAEVNLAQAIRNLSQTHAGMMAKNSNIRLNLTIEPELPRVIADPELLRRLLQGLLNRAVARSEFNDTIHIEAKSQSDQVWVSVKDEGPAVSDTELPHIFDKTFVKLGNRSGFTGLEMALVKTIIDRMGGQVLVGGQGQKGSPILICLPCSTGRKAEG
jgi:signal transduction histidine kinase